MLLYIKRKKPIPTVVFDAYWEFAAERQAIFFRRIQGHSYPWTEDVILRRHKFTNAYRASDRVSQYLIRNIIYKGDLSIEEVFFRTILFKLFNKIETWELFEGCNEQIKISSFKLDKFSKVLSEAMSRGRKIYSGAYIMASGKSAFGLERKHENHLLLLKKMLNEKVPLRIASSPTMEKAFEILKSYPSIGDFLAFQFLTDLAYGPDIIFTEMDYIVPGPGAKGGISKCFSDMGEYSEAEIIRWVCEMQKEEFDKRGINFLTLWGRPLQLIDCQNIFCEIDKYSRVAFPTIRGISDRHRIKQVFIPTLNFEPIRFWYPPKWGINHLITLPFLMQ